MTVVLRGGRVIDSGGERLIDVEIGDDGLIAAVGTGLTGDLQLDASGCVVSPGFVDLHVHLREPGQEDAETIQTGARGGALGGYTARGSWSTTASESSPTTGQASRIRA